MPARFLWYRIYILFCIACGSAHADEINYYNKPWADVAAKAKAEHKYIYLDCYTEWCGWCKEMDKVTMTDTAIISYINAHFIPVRMDMEHGEGLKLAMKYQITGFPTFMFFDPEGHYVYVKMGFARPAEFMTELTNALDPAKQFHAPGYSLSLDVPYPTFYSNAFLDHDQKKMPTLQEVTTWLDAQTDLFSEPAWAVLARFGGGEKYSTFLLTNAKKYESLYGKAVSFRLLSLLYSRLMEAEKNNSDDQFAATMALVDKCDSANAPLYRLHYYTETKQWAKYAASFDGYISAKGYSDPAYINQQCQNLYKNCDDQPLLKKATAAMKEVAEKAPDYKYIDTYASLLYKTGDTKHAEKWAQKAIETGKKNGNDVAATEDLLNKIKAAK